MTSGSSSLTSFDVTTGEYTDYTDIYGSSAEEWRPGAVSGATGFDTNDTNSGKLVGRLTTNQSVASPTAAVAVVSEAIVSASTEGVVSQLEGVVIRRRLQAIKSYFRRLDDNSVESDRREKKITQLYFDLVELSRCAFSDCSCVCKYLYRFE